MGSLTGKEKKLVVLCRSNGAQASGRLFYTDEDGQLVSLSFDPATGAVSGSPQALANVVGFQPGTYWAEFTVAANGTVVYNSKTGGSISELVWIDRTGKQVGKLGEPAVMCNPAISPDGLRVATDITDEKANNVDIWFLSTTDRGSTRFTFDPQEETNAVWSRDGKTVTYRSNLLVGTGLLVQPATGLVPSKTLVKYAGTDDIIPNSWSRDDSQILSTHSTPSGDYLELLSSAGGAPVRFHKGTGSENTGMISPDGKWVAYASDESGNWEIYVTTFPSAAGKCQVSRGGGTQPRWREDGKEIFYEGPTGVLTAVPVNYQSGFTTGTPVSLFQIHGRPQISSTDTFTYDVAKDGQRFLVNRYVTADYIKPLTIVLNAAAPERQ